MGYTDPEYVLSLSDQTEGAIAFLDPRCRNLGLRVLLPERAKVSAAPVSIVQMTGFNPASDSTGMLVWACFVYCCSLRLPRMGNAHARLVTVEKYGF